MTSHVDRYKVDVPEGVSGDWSVRRMTVSPHDESFGRMRAAVTGSGRFVPAGTYTALRHRGDIVMSDTPDEIRDHLDAIFNARGHCLVAGLGLGLVAQAVASKPNVARVTIVEKSPDVIKLVAPWLRGKFGDRVEIVEADVFTWAPPRGSKFGMAWFDVWDSICRDNVEEMKRLHRKFARRAEWKGSWAREECESGR